MYADRPDVTDAAGSDELANFAVINSPRRIRLQTALAKLRGAIVFPGISRHASDVRACFARIDAIDLDAIEAAIKQARAMCDDEGPALHTARLDQIAALVVGAHASVNAAIVDGLDGADLLPHHGHALVAARDKLAAIRW
jgi:hypothetical protein